MDDYVFLLVLLAAVLHATWNALVKAGGDSLVRLALINVTSGVIAAPLLFVVAVPDPRVWPWLLASAAVHSFYYYFLVMAYRFGDLSQVYPIARGVAPLLVATGAFLFAGETLQPLGIVAVMVISVAILSLAWGRGAPGGGSAKPVIFALCTGITISTYTIIDGIGGRLSADVLAYIVWLFVLDAVPIAVVTVVARRGRLLDTLRVSWRAGLIGGALSLGGYGLVIWAMSLVPMTYVSALRETSVIIATIIGTRMLGEPMGRQRVTAAALVVAGVALLQWSRLG